MVGGCSSSDPLQVVDPATLCKSEGRSFHRGHNEEWVIFIGEGEVAVEMGGEQHHRGVLLHLEQVVLVLPNERHVFELLDVVLGGQSTHSVLVGQQEIVDKLFSPLDDALDHVQRQHSQRVQDVHALVEKLGVALLVLGV